MDLDQTIERYHLALREFVEGDHEPLWAMYSRWNEAFLCNPFVAFARGPQQVEEAMKIAASHWEGGEIDFKNMVKYETVELAYVIEQERFKATIDDTERSGTLRVTSILRREEGDWKVVHRHADPVPTGPAGSLRE